MRNAALQAVAPNAAKSTQVHSARHGPGVRRPRHYQKIERGAPDIRLSTTKKLADCLEVTLADLMHGA